MNVFQSISFYFNLFPFGQLASGGWQAARGCRMNVFQFISSISNWIIGYFRQTKNKMVGTEYF